MAQPTSALRLPPLPAATSPTLQVADPFSRNERLRLQVSPEDRRDEPATWLFEVNLGIAHLSCAFAKGLGAFARRTPRLFHWKKAYLKAIGPCRAINYLILFLNLTTLVING